MTSGFTSRSEAWGADRSDGGSTQALLICVEAAELNNNAGIAKTIQTRFRPANINFSINPARVADIT
jgi:hypothetical protein